MTSLPAEAAEKLFEAAADAGVARRDLLAAVGIEAGAPLTSEAMCALYEQAARLSGDPAFGLRVGERTSARMYGLLGYVTANSRSFGEALSSLASFQRLWTDAVVIEVARSPKGVGLSYRHSASLPADRRRQESEQMIAAFLTFAREVLGREVRPVEVRFEHSPPADRSEHQRVFGCPVRFRAPATELVLDPALLALQLPAADPQLLKLIREQAEAALANRLDRHPLAARIDAGLRAAILGSRELSLNALARELKLGPRTLQRRLRERGLTFREAADQARLGLARELLGEPHLPLAQIAHRLGYSQPSAFHRAFRRMAGITPRGFRRSLSTP